jgi:WG containing repeat/YARHG domain
MKSSIISTVAILAMAVACSVITKKDLEKDVNVFLMSFQNNLSKSNDEILKQFKTDQGKESILSAIEILKNKNTSFVEIEVNYKEAKTSWNDDSSLKVEIPVVLMPKGKGLERLSFDLILLRKSQGYFISQIDAENLFARVRTLRFENTKVEELSKLLSSLKTYFDQAKALQNEYDTVVWYVNHKDKTYYYVINGMYDFESLQKGTSDTSKYKMGLVDDSGKVIVPPEYDLIGSPSINIENAIEVKSNGKTGYYSLEGTQIIPANYDWVVSFDKGKAIALLKSDSTFDWLDNEMTIHSGFPSVDAQNFIKDFSFLTSKKVQLGAAYHDLTNVLSISPNHDPVGLAIPPAYLVHFGIFKSIEDNFISSNEGPKMDYYWGGEFIHNTNQIVFSISETISAIVSNFERRFIGGRGEFYRESKLLLVNNSMETLGEAEAEGSSVALFRKLNSELIEEKFQIDDMMGPADYIEQDIPYYRYFRVDSTGITKLESKREFHFTEFVKIDSSYFSGNFNTYDYGTSQQGKSMFLSKETIEHIRDEILASYGFIFTDPKKMELFKVYKWYAPSISSYEEIYYKATEIERFNLDFLAKLIGSIPTEKPS